MRTSSTDATKPRRRARRLVLAGALIATGALAFGASEARAGKYQVAQCGWRIGADADWDQHAAPSRFRPEAFCLPPDGSDPFDGVHLSSTTRPGGGTVAGGKFARWRWVAPPGTGIVHVRGLWWSALRDGFEQRLGTGGGGDFSPFATADAAHTPPGAFAAGLRSARRSFQSRLLCARPEGRRCDLGPASFAAIRSVELTLTDDSSPRPQLGGGIAARGWRRGTQSAEIGATDSGSGVRSTETLIDGARIARSEHACFEKKIGGGLEATRMGPCELRRTASQPVDTARISDGRHRLRACAIDFAGNRRCTARRLLRTDNTAPAAPRGLELRGGGGWQRRNVFEPVWANPDQGPGSPIAGASYRLTGPGGFDSGERQRAKRGITSLGRLTVPRPGAYLLGVWLRDEAGNESPSNSSGTALLFDDLSPSVTFQNHRDRAHPEIVAATVRDRHSGPADGVISYRRAGRRRWTSLPSTLRHSPEHQGEAELLARFPSDRVRPGRYRFRATVADAAGNRAASTRRSNGSAMVLHAPLKRRTRLRARLRLGGRGGRRLKVPYGARPELTGRLGLRAGAGLAGRRLRIAIRPARGSLAGFRLLHARTGPGGRFRVELGTGTSRRLRVSFAGSEVLARDRAAPLRLLVRAGVELSASRRALRTGELLRLSGIVHSGSARLPSRGKLVMVEYLERAGGRWAPVLLTRTGREGLFRARYRFRYVSGVARIRLRALAPPEQGWPYAAGASAPLTVTVRG